jgi:hypothetical protein
VSYLLVHTEYWESKFLRNVSSLLQNYVTLHSNLQIRRLENASYLNQIILTINYGEFSVSFISQNRYCFVRNVVTYAFLT